ncbi:EamA family transporter [Candidatus Woesearchaeota archaeon]|nr:EamA family transporter [Candidatus Woesearchaeota archaeon]
MAIICAVVGQLILKKGMGKREVSIRLKSVFRDVFRLYWDALIIVGLFFYCLSALLWLVALSKVDLSYGYPLVSVNYVLVALASKFIFKERISYKRWLSILVIVLGVVVLAIS